MDGKEEGARRVLESGGSAIGDSFQNPVISGDRGGPEVEVLTSGGL